MPRRLYRLWAALLLVAPASAQPAPFHTLKVGVDAEGFITLREGEGPAEGYFPLDKGAGRS